MGMVLMSIKDIILLILLMSISVSLWAKDIDMQASISSSLDYSDNINLDARNEKNDFILRVTPGIRFKKEGARVKTNLNYSLTGLLYASETDKNDIQHRLNATADSEIIKHSIFLDLDAGITQELLNPNQFASTDGVSGSQNLTQTYTYGFSPYWRKKWSKYANSVLRYDYNELKYDGGNSSSDDSTSDRVSLDVSSGRAFDFITWNVAYNHRETRYEKSNNVSDDIMSLVLANQYSRQLQLRLTTGYEDYHSKFIDADSIWAVGFKWTPSTRNTLDLDIGNRFFGNTYRLDYRHRARRFNWNVTYHEDVTDQRSQIRQNNQDREDNPGNIIPPIGTNRNQASRYLSRIGRSNLTYSYSKTTLGWGIYHERRYYQDADVKDEDNYGTSLSWGWRLAKKTTMNTSVLWSVYDDVFINEKQTRSSLSWSLNRRMTPDTSAYVRFLFQNNNADRKTNEYTENRISVGLRKQF